VQIKPILAALRHHKAGTLLIVTQIALTLAIVSNAVFIIAQRVAYLSRPTGIDQEADIVIVSNRWLGSHSATAAIDAMTATDLDVLRHLPGVMDVYPTNTYPLRGVGWQDGITVDPDHGPSSGTSLYFSDEHTLATLGLKLVAGRNFRKAEIGPMGRSDKLAAPQIIVTRQLADTLFPDGHAVGKTTYIEGSPNTIIGVVDRLQGSFAASATGAAIAERVTLVPLRPAYGVVTYIVRSEPGQTDAVVHAAPAALIAANRMRLTSARSFIDVRNKAYEHDRGLAIMMGTICVVLLTITASGIVGLTSFWVGQRRRQIGIRRALGATRRDILDYFLAENLLIGIGGVALGALLAIGLDLALMSHFELTPMPLAYVGIGVIVLLVLGQGAVLAPAIRASRVPPVEATRSG
jgi:putative ABC transport system permease protein